MTNNTKRLTKDELQYIDIENDMESLTSQDPTDRLFIMQLLNERAEAVRLLKECVQHLDYIGWGDSYEREGVCRKGELVDQAKAFVKDAVSP